MHLAIWTNVFLLKPISTTTNPPTYHQLDRDEEEHDDVLQDQKQDEDKDQIL